MTPTLSVLLITSSICGFEIGDSCSSAVTAFVKHEKYDIMVENWERKNKEYKLGYIAGIAGTVRKREINIPIYQKESNAFKIEANFERSRFVFTRDF